MKKTLKRWLAEIDYQLYHLKIKKNKIRVMSIDETLKELNRTNKSMVRFGDGEIVMIKGKSLKLQQASSEISKGLTKILSYPNPQMIVTVQGVFDGVEGYHKKSRLFWKDHLLFCRKIYHQYCDPDRIYGDTAVSRCYYSFENKNRCESWFNQFRQVWENKDIVVVEGSRTHNGVGNNLFDNANSVERIICPPSNAFEVRDSILQVCYKYPKDKIFLLSVGVTAKFLTVSLFEAGYRVIDLGNLDMEYEWFLMKASEKVLLKKHELDGEEANRKAGYTEYLAQIATVIEHFEQSV